jgi:hypothetical protein
VQIRVQAVRSVVYPGEKLQEQDRSLLLVSSPLPFFYGPSILLEYYGIFYFYHNHLYCITHVVILSVEYRVMFGNCFQFRPLRGYEVDWNRYSVTSKSVYAVCNYGAIQTLRNRRCT